MERYRLTTRCYVCKQLLDPQSSVFDGQGVRHMMCWPRTQEARQKRTEPCSAHDHVVDGD